MLSGNGQARPYYDTNMDRLTITRQPMTAKPKLSSLYSLSNAFDLISGSKFGEDIVSKYLETTPVYQWANPSCVYTHAHNALTTTAW